MKEIIGVPVSPLQHNVIDKTVVNIPETQSFVVKPLDRGVGLVKYNSFVLHVVCVFIV